jgi:hypothetical protein
VVVVVVGVADDDNCKLLDNLAPGEVHLSILDDTFSLTIRLAKMMENRVERVCWGLAFQPVAIVMA